MTVFLGFIFCSIQSSIQLKCPLGNPHLNPINFIFLFSSSITSCIFFLTSLLLEFILTLQAISTIKNTSGIKIHNDIKANLNCGESDFDRIEPKIHAASVAPKRIIKTKIKHRMLLIADLGFTVAKLSVLL